MKKRRLIAGALAAALISAVSFGFSGCGVTPDETTKDKWIKNELAHWQEVDGDDTAIIGYAEHSFASDGKCTACGYKQHTSNVHDKLHEQDASHEHSWSDKWATNTLHHWHASICNDTNEIKDKSEHNFVNYVCTECGYNKLIDANKLPETDFSDVGEKFNTVVAPIYDATQTILKDLAENGDIVLNNARNPRIVGIRYCYGLSFQIAIREDIFIGTDGDKAEFLQRETWIDLKNFGKANDEAYLAYSSFLKAERKSQSRSNYEELILPYAKRSANLILAQYESYKDNKDIHLSNHGKVLILSAESSLSEAYNRIVANLNSALAKKGYPLITNQDLDIGFGGNINWEIVNRWILIEANVGNLCYNFYISFNEDGELSENFINNYMGTLHTGYASSDPDLYNPKNEEYAEFFESIKIEKIDLSNIEDTYKYDGNGSAIYRPDGEYTIINF